jgi:hypothetical protein
MQQLVSESTIVEFSYRSPHADEPPDAYLLRFRGRGLQRDDSHNRIAVRETHEVSVELGAGYPRQMPALAWRSPVFHPNISGSGIVCLGGYASHWVPSLTLPELCRMLWDMVRYANYDVESPYNREAAVWARNQRDVSFPLDVRPLRDKLLTAKKPSFPSRPVTYDAEVVFLESQRPPRGTSQVVEAQVVEAEVAARPDPDILFID